MNIKTQIIEICKAAKIASAELAILPSSKN
jgi:hypothetical protein